MLCQNSTNSAGKLALLETLRFERLIEQSNFDSSSKRVYLSRLRVFKKFFETNFETLSLEEVAAEFMTEIQSRSSEHTAYNFSVLFRLMSRYLGRQIYTTTSSDIRHAPLNSAQVQRLIEVARKANRERDLLAVSIFLSTDLRLSEIASLRVADIVNVGDSGWIVLEAGRKSGDSTKMVQISDAVAQSLANWLASRNSEQSASAFVFPGPGGAHIRAASLSKAITNLGHKANLCICPQRLRNTYLAAQREFV
ncbi:MAG: site-specific integrase [Candidatus Obscuribacterales bacterium]|nr:site-specific integrase [Candidatus Obscuribacterales bacterium]